MPLKSKAQLGKLFSMEKNGEIKKGMAEEFAKKTLSINKLPYKVKKKK